MIAFIKKYHVIFLITLLINIYFFVTELINYFSSNMTAAICLCGAVMYLATILFISAIEFLKTFKINSYWAYFATLIFLVINLVSTPTILLVGGLTDSMQMVYRLSAVFNPFMVFLLILVYIGYLVFKVIIPLIRSLISRILRDDYGRCRRFGDIVSGTYTLLMFIASFFSFMGVAGFIDAMVFEKTLMIIVYVPLLFIIFVFTSIYIFKCIRGMSKVNKPKTAVIKK